MDQGVHGVIDRSDPNQINREVEIGANSIGTDCGRNRQSWGEGVSGRVEVRLRYRTKLSDTRG